MSVLEETKFILNKYKIGANKSLGQNFLIDDSIVESIIDTSNLTKDDLVIEIGPGLGVLTNKLLEKANKVIAIELDKRMIEILSDRFKLYNNLEIINDDVLKVDLENLIEKEKGNNAQIENVKIVANLPYYISTPIIIKLLELKLQIDSIIVMVQKEVADRLTAKTGTRLAGAITYMVDYYSEAENVVDVNKNCFLPSPKVDSRVIKLQIRKEPKIQVEDEEKLFDLIQKCFSQRRKTLANVLVNYNFAKDKETAINILKKINLSEDVRGETLTLEKYKKILEIIN